MRTDRESLLAAIDAAGTLRRAAHLVLGNLQVAHNCATTQLARRAAIRVHGHLVGLDLAAGAVRALLVRALQQQQLDAVQLAREAGDDFLNVETPDQGAVGLLCCYCRAVTWDLGAVVARYCQGCGKLLDPQNEETHGID